MRLSIVLPVHSETEVLRELTTKFMSLVGGDLYEILFIVSPRSPQATFAVVEALAREYPIARWEAQRENPGLGYGVRQGLGSVTGTHVLMIDSDGEMTPETVPAMVEKMRQTGCDMVVASRWMRGGGVIGYDRRKLWFNRGFQLVFRLAFRTRIHDLTQGFKLARLDKVREVRWTSQFHDFSMETTLRPIRLGWHVEEVPTTWIARQSGVSQNPFRRNLLYVARALEILMSGGSRAARSRQEA